MIPQATLVIQKNPTETETESFSAAFWVCELPQFISLYLVILIWVMATVLSGSEKDETGLEFGNCIDSFLGIIGAESNRATKKKNSDSQLVF